MKKTVSIISIIFFLVTVVATSYAQQNRGQRFKDRFKNRNRSPQTDGSESNRRDRPNRPSREQILKRFDANNDGRLDESERATAQAERQKMRNKVLADFDANGNGKIDQDEKVRLQESRKHERIAKLDTDGDGKLSDTEKAVGLKQHLTKLQAKDPEKYIKLLERLDANKDGEIDLQEMEKGRNARRNTRQKPSNNNDNQNYQEIEKGVRKYRRITRQAPSNNNNNVSNADDDTDLSFMDGI